MREAEFTIDTFPGLKFNGFTDDEDWNGWACPYFTFEDGARIVEAHKTSNENAWFSEFKDEFVFEINGETEIYPAVNFNGMKLYPIGNGSWIWEEVENKKNAL